MRGTNGLKTIKIKNCEGYDRIPQRILSDGANILIGPFTGLFERIYNQKSIPEQWSISKVIPIFKKGLKNNIENYRPIANLCSSSKLFEKLILKRMLNIELEHNVDLTGKQQHRFKQKKEHINPIPPTPIPNCPGIGRGQLCVDGKH